MVLPRAMRGNLIIMILLMSRSEVAIAEIRFRHLLPCKGRHTLPALHLFLILLVWTVRSVADLQASPTYYPNEVVNGVCTLNNL